MTELRLQNVSADLWTRIERLAERERQTPEAAVLHLLERTVPRDPPENREHVRAILERIQQNRITPTSATPDSVELLREDRNR